MLFEAYDRLPAQEAQPLNYAWPMVVVILSVPLLKQPLGRISLAAIVVSFCGVLVIGTRGDLLAFRFSDPIGTALAVGSAFIWATFWLTNVRDDRDAVVKLLLNFVFGLAFVSVAAVALAGPPPLDLRGIGGSAYAGVFEMGLTFVLWMRALSLSRTTAQVSNLVYLSPFLSLVFISVIVGETIRPASVIGLLLIRGGDRHPPLRADVVSDQPEQPQPGSAARYSCPMAAMRSMISSIPTSSTWLAMDQWLPKGSATRAQRSP